MARKNQSPDPKRSDADPERFSRTFEDLEQSALGDVDEGVLSAVLEDSITDYHGVTGGDAGGYKGIVIDLATGEPKKARRKHRRTRGSGKEI